VNIANMQLAHASERGHEFAVRRAMGAGRRRLLRLHLTGSLLLALVGGAAGTLLAVVLIRILIGIVPMNVPRIEEAALNPSVLFFALAVSLGAAVLFGLLPGLRATSAGQQGLVAQAGSRMTAGRRQRRSRDLLVGFELVLSVILLAGAGLLLRTLDNLYRVDPGFEHENLLTVNLALPQSRYPDPNENVRFYERLRAEMVRLPMVEQATVRSMLALGGGGFNLWRAYLAEGWEEPPAGIELTGPWVVVGDEHFRTVGLPLQRGRTFTPADDADHVPVMIINEAMAGEMFGDEEPIGKRVRSWRDENLYREIVGVVGNELMTGAADIERNIAYVPHRQNPWRNMTFLIRTLGDPYTAVEDVRGVIGDFDPELPVMGFSTMDDALTNSAVLTATLTRLLSAFAATALLLAAVGIFGVLSYVVSLRRREIGIRLAVGADGARVGRLLIGETFRIVLASLFLGLVGAQLLGRLLQGQLFGVTPLDPITLLGVSVMVVATTFIATLVPVLRAARIDPMAVLRVE
jgi:putative ABC transport system permease protein